MNVWGVTFGGYLAKILNFKSGNLFYKSNFYLLSEGTVQESGIVPAYHDIPTATHSLIAADSAINHHAFV